jgi:hypothetical protein
MSDGRDLLFSVQPFVWGYKPAIMLEREGVHTGWVT